jgi:hypothetical protein
MPYHLSNHIYVAQFREELILLDLRRDKYMICSHQFSELLMSLLEEKQVDLPGDFFSSSELQYSSPRLSNIQKLIDDGILETKDTIYPFHIDRKVDSDGVSNVDWRLPLENKKAPVNMLVLKAFTVLMQVHLYIKTRGFYSTIQLIKKSRKPHLNYIVPSDEKLRELANTLNKACLIYPTRTKCLEWASAFVLLALKRRWKCNLEIGVQNYPFLSHAWVECDGKVIMDSQYLREGLSIILNEPFRKLKI